MLIIQSFLWKSFLAKYIPFRRLYYCLLPKAWKRFYELDFQTLDLTEENIFIDNGVSGSCLERPALDNLRDKAFTGSIQRILISSPDRLARKYSHQIILIEEALDTSISSDKISILDEMDY